MSRVGGDSAAVHLGLCLQELRKRSGFSLRQVDALSRNFSEPVSYDYLSRAESGQFIPSPQKLITLGHIYEIPPQHFLDKLDLVRFEAYAPTSRDPEVCRQQGVAAAELGDYRAAYAAFRKGLNLIESSEEAGVDSRKEQSARLRNNMAIALMRLGKHRMAEQEVEKVLEVRGRSGYASCRALNALSLIHYQLDRNELAEAIGLAALRVARRERDSGQIAQALINVANARFDLDRIQPAIRFYRKALALAAEGTLRNEVILVHYNLGNCYKRLEQKVQAESSFRAGLRLAEQLPAPHLKARGLLNLGRFLHGEGRTLEARSALHEARSLAMTHDLRSETFHTTYYLWRIALGEQVGSEAVELFRALKRLRLRVDQRSEEVVSFDAYLTEIRSRGRKGVSNVEDLSASPAPHRSPRSRKHE